MSCCCRWIVTAVNCHCNLSRCRYYKSGGGHPANLLPPSLSQAGIPEDSKVEGPAFTDAIRMYRQSKELYGTWEMLCGNEVQVRLGRLRKPTRGPGLDCVRRRGPGALAAGLDPDDELGRMGGG